MRTRSSLTEFTNTSTSYVGGRDLVGFVDEAKTLVTQKVPLPTGYRISWGGQFENQQRAAARLTVVVPVALGLIFLLLLPCSAQCRLSTQPGAERSGHPYG